MYAAVGETEVADLNQEGYGFQMGITASQYLRQRSSNRCSKVEILLRTRHTGDGGNVTWRRQQEGPL